MPEALYFYTQSDWEQFDGSEAWEPASIAAAYWSMTGAYIFGDGYHAIGWRPSKGIETWVMEHVLSFLLRHYSADYARFVGAEPLEEDDSICRLPVGEQEARL